MFKIKPLVAHPSLCSTPGLVRLVNDMTSHPVIQVKSITSVFLSLTYILLISKPISSISKRYPNIDQAHPFHHFEHNERHHHLCSGHFSLFLLSLSQDRECAQVVEGQQEGEKERVSSRPHAQCRVQCGPRLQNYGIFFYSCIPTSVTF